MSFLNFSELNNKKSAYFNNDWIRFNEDYYGLKAEKIEFNYKAAKLEGILYKNKKGKICVPPEDRYIAIRFIPSDTKKECQLYSQRLEVMKQLSDYVAKNGIEGTICLPPGYIDARPFMWLGKRVSVGYTFLTKLPLDEGGLDSSVRNKVKKAISLNYVVKQTTEWDKVVYCYNKTREYKDLGKYVTVKMMENLVAHSHLNPEPLVVAHLGETIDGTPVCAQIKLLEKDGICIDWVAGTDRDHISSGINQQVYHKSIEDITTMGGAYFDYCGANDFYVAQAKSSWGLELVPFLVLSEGSTIDRIRVLAKKNSFITGIYRKILAKKKAK